MKRSIAEIYGVVSKENVLALHASNKSVKKIARIIGVAPSTLERKFKKWGISIAKSKKCLVCKKNFVPNIKAQKCCSCECAEKRDDWENIYYQSGNMAKTAKKIGISVTELRKKFIEQDIIIASRGGANRKKKIKYDIAKKQAVLDVIARHTTKKAAAAELGISSANLNYWLKEWNENT